jgi:pSer/pThr/pTyr-binding forkhead associated (FHA) protein
MIDVACSCGSRESLPESGASSSWICPNCGVVTHLTCGEALPEDAGAGDFDGCLTVVAGPSRVGERFLLGGVAEIQIGKLPEKQIQLLGTRVSRNHCTLRRIDFGPSRWTVVDTKSTYGLMVNGERVSEQEISPGDSIEIGEFALQYSLMPAAEPEPVASITAPPPSPPAAPARSSGPRTTVYTGPKPTQPVAQARQLSYATAEKEDGPKLLGDCDITWVMRLRNASTLMFWTVVIKWVVLKFGLNLFLSFVPHSGEVINIAVSGLMVVAVWLLTTKEPESSWDLIGARTLLRLFGIVGYAGSIAMSVGTIMASRGDVLDEDGEPTKAAVTVGVSVIIATIVSFAQVPAVALLLFYIRRLAKRIPNEGLAFTATLLMIAAPIFLGMFMWAGYQALRGSGVQAAGFAIVALIGLLICEVGRLGCLVWFNKSFS